MNKTYRIVWNRVRNCLMVVSETTKSSGKAGVSKAVALGAVVAAIGALGVSNQAHAQTVWTSGNKLVPPNVTDGLLVRSGSVVGTLTVNVGSSINGATNGLEVSNSTVSGDVINAGVIEGANKGILIEASNPAAVHASIGGSILNSGTILGNANTGIYIKRATVSGSISNSGSIYGGYYGINISQSMLSGGISNAGTITSGQYSGILINRSTVIGGVLNTGYLSGQGSAALIVSAASVAGGIKNSGTVIGSRGIYIYGNSTTHSSVTGGITNAGKIETTSEGVSVYQSTLSGWIVNQPNAIIDSASTGVIVRTGQVIGGISNAGLIQGVSQQAVRVFNSTVVGSIINAGTLLGGQMGINVSLSSVSGDITNTVGGTISAGVGVVVQNSTVSGAIVNVGRIEGSSYGIQVTHSSLAGGVQNQLGGTIIGATGLLVNSSNTSITNSGFINGSGGVAVSASGTTVVVKNTTSGTIVGALVGTMNVTNAGLLALQTMSGSTISAGSHVNANITGNYVQNDSAATLQIGVAGVSNSGTLAANFSHLTVSGIASLTAGTVSVSMNNDSAVQAGGTLVGVVRSTSNQLTATGLTITDNSALVNFNYITTAGGVLSLVAVANAVTCAANITGSQQGPCEVAFDKQTINVLAAGSIGGAATGIKVLTGAITAGGIVNAGTVLGSSYGIRFQPGTTFTGNITNSGLVQGTTTGIRVAGTINGRIVNTVGGSIGGGVNGIQLVSGASVVGGIVNYGTVTGGSGAGVNVGAGATLSGVAQSGNSYGIQNVGYISNINNAGQVWAANVAISLLTGSQVANGITNTGTIQSSQIGVMLSHATLSGGLSNAGVINATYYGVAQVGGSFSGGLNNTGTIIGQYLNGLFFSAATLSGGITNSGTIASLAAAAILVDVGSLLTGGLSNSGQLLGDLVLGVGSTLSGGVQNTGSMASINNSGLITASGYAIAVNAGQVDSITNSGFIGGGSGAISVSGSATLNNILITGNNTASFGGAVYAPNTPVTVAGGATFTLNSDFAVSNFANEGVVIASGSPTVTGNLSNAAGASVIGAINGLTNVSNSGLLALQTISGGTIVDGSHVSTSISGNYVQNASTGILSIGVNGTSGSGTTSGNYSQLAVGGIASLTAGSINVSMSSATAVQSGGTLAGVVTSTANQLTATGLTVTDNSALVNFVYSTTAGALDLVAVVNRNLCGANITGSQQGPCEIAFDNQTINIAATGSIGGAASGIKVLSGAITAGSIVNAGTVMGSAYGINVLAGSTFSGGITNSGLIAGGVNAIYVDSASSVDRIVIAGNNTASFGGAVYAPNTPVTVAGGATYTLNSNFEVANFNNQGTVVASIAAASNTTITGNYTQGSTGSLAIEAASASSHGALNVSGLASFGANASIQVVTISGNTLSNGNTLVGVVNAGSLSASTFNVTDNSALLDFSANVVGNRVDLCAYTSGSNCGANPGPSPVPQSTAIQNAVASTGNKAGAGAATALDSVLTSYLSGSTTYAAMNPVMDALVNIPTNQGVSNAVSQTLPVMSGATVWNTMSVLTSINRIIEARHLVNKGISSGEDFSGNNALWMKPFGTWTDQGNQNGAYGFKANTGGLMLGGDTTVGADTRLGLAFGWGNSYATSNAGVAPQSQTSNLYQFIGYGSYALSGSLEANFQANGGWNNNTSNRQIGFMGTSAQGSYNSAVWHVGAGLSNPFHVTETTQLIPSARFDYTWIKNQGYSETGASNGLGLNVNSETYQTSILGADLKGIQKLTDHNSVNANIGVGYNFSPTQTWVAASFQGAPGLQFTTNGINPQAVMGRAGVGYTYKVNNGLDLGVRYDLDFQNSYTNQTATAKARWMF